VPTTGVSSKTLPYFPKKTEVFPVGPNKKKEKIGTIFCPKGGLAVVPLNKVCNNDESSNTREISYLTILFDC
jgi:hypothetical protein